ncbi:Uncharacterised protein [Mycobacteroides abscessus subsp. abscessus]|nr:Uncharacterised protein [Mycobacteroides abscessus subsp. abscessus]
MLIGSCPDGIVCSSVPWACAAPDGLSAGEGTTVSATGSEAVSGSSGGTGESGIDITGDRSRVEGLPQTIG